MVVTTEQRRDGTLASTRTASSELVGAVDGMPSTLTRAGMWIFRYGLALVFLWIGLLKFTTYEAKGIEPLLMNSPLLGWALNAFGLPTLSGVIGVIEIAIGILIAARSVWPKASAIGSLGAAITFVITLSFLLTTPGVLEMGRGFPFLSAMPGQFLLKDLVLLGVSLWTAGEALQAAWVQKNRLR